VGVGVTRSAIRGANAFLCVVAVLAAVLAAMPAVSSAQGAPAAATPEARSAVLLALSLEDLPPPPAFIRLVRITLQPGAMVAAHSHPGPEAALVERGSLTVETDRMPLVQRAAGGEPAGAGAGAEAATPTGPLALAEGDRVVYPAGSAFGFRNDGDAPTSLLTAIVLPAGENRPAGSAWVDGAPRAEEMQGVTSRILGDAVAPGWPAPPMALEIDRLALAPGEPVPAWPGPVMLAVESGTLGFALEGGEYQVSRNGSIDANAEPGAVETLAVDESVFFPGGMGELARPAGDPAVVLLRLGVASLNPAATPMAPAPGPSATAEAAVSGATPEPPRAMAVSVTVTEDGVRLRAEPSTEGEVVAELVAGTPLAVTGPAVEVDGIVWFPVSLADDATVAGFVAEQYLSAAG